MVPVGIELVESQIDLDKFNWKHQSVPYTPRNEEGKHQLQLESKVPEIQLPGLCKQIQQSILGHAPHFSRITDQFHARPTLSILLSILESILRSVSNVILISNPISGLIILSTMCISAPSAAVLGMISLLSGIFTSFWLVRLPMEITRGGSVTFNCFLLGSILGPLVGGRDFNTTGDLIPICIGVGIFAIFCWGGLQGLLSRANIPVLNAPTNILSLIFIYSGLASYFRLGPSSGLLEGDDYSGNATSTEVFGNFNEKEVIMGSKNRTIEGKLKHLETILASHEPLDWYKILGGIILAQGQIFQTNSIPASVIVYLCVLLYSPILFLQELLGATIASLIGIGLSKPPYSDLYDGSWGYNSLLTSGAIGGFFIAFNLQAWILSVLASIISALIYSTLTNSGIPALGIPFMVTTWLFLPITNSISNLDLENKEIHYYKLYRVSDFTTPEINRRCCTKLKIVNVDDKYYRPNSTVLPI